MSGGELELGRRRIRLSGVLIPSPAAIEREEERDWRRGCR
jgi:hypothetical protein